MTAPVVSTVVKVFNDERHIGECMNNDIMSIVLTRVARLSEIVRNIFCRLKCHGWHPIGPAEGSARHLCAGSK